MEMGLACETKMINTVFCYLPDSQITKTDMLETFCRYNNGSSS